MNMNKTYIAVYSIITVLIIILLNIYINGNRIYQSRINKIDNNYGELNKAIANNSSGNLLLVTGNSYVNHSFDTSISKGEMVKFAVNGMSFYDVVNIVENLPRKTPITTVLIGIGYDYAIPSKSNSSSYEKHFSTNWVSEMWHSLPMVRGRSRTTVMLREDIHCLLSNLIKIKCKREALEEDEGKETSLFADSKYREKDIAERFNMYVPLTSSVDQNFVLLLERLMAACKLREIDLYAYTAPIYKELLIKLDSQVIEKFHNSIFHAGINYRDLNHVFPEWDYTMFSDATHVNHDKASKQITKALLDWIATL